MTLMNTLSKTVKLSYLPGITGVVYIQNELGFKYLRI